jgi:hypothetical protein
MLLKKLEVDKGCNQKGDNPTGMLRDREIKLLRKVIVLFVLIEAARSFL